MDLLPRRPSPIDDVGSQARAADAARVASGRPLRS